MKWFPILISSRRCLKNWEEETKWYRSSGTYKLSSEAATDIGAMPWLFLLISKLKYGRNRSKGGLLCINQQAESKKLAQLEAGSREEEEPCSIGRAFFASPAREALVGFRRASWMEHKLFWIVEERYERFCQSTSSRCSFKNSTRKPVQWVVTCEALARSLSATFFFVRPHLNFSRVCRRIEHSKRRRLESSDSFGLWLRRLVLKSSNT